MSRHFEPATRPVRILAVGSPYGDDRVAWSVAERLRKLPEFAEQLADRVSVIECDRPGPGLIDYLCEHGFAIIVDAVFDGGAPGRICRVDELGALDAFSHWSSHGLGLADSLRLAAQIGRLRAKWVVYGISIEMPPADAVGASAISAEVASAASRLARILVEEARAELPLDAYAMERQAG